MSKLYFFRHAQASFGADNYDALSRKGEQQSLELGKYLVAKKYQFDKVFVGPLRRQQHTFELVKSIYNKHNVPMPAPIMVEGLREHEGPEALEIILPKLQERAPFKKMIAKMVGNPERAKANRLLVFQLFMEEWAQGNIEVPGVVPWKEFRLNAREGLRSILEATGSGETNAAFSSGGTISAITAEALKVQDEQRVASLNFSIRNTSYTSFFYSKGKFNLLGLNEIPHLKEEMVTFV